MKEKLRKDNRGLKLSVSKRNSLIRNRPGRLVPGPKIARTRDHNRIVAAERRRVFGAVLQFPVSCFVFVTNFTFSQPSAACVVRFGVKHEISGLKEQQKPLAEVTTSLDHWIT